MNIQVTLDVEHDVNIVPVQMMIASPKLTPVRMRKLPKVHHVRYPNAEHITPDRQKHMGKHVEQAWLQTEWYPTKQYPMHGKLVERSKEPMNKDIDTSFVKRISNSSLETVDGDLIAGCRITTPTMNIELDLPLDSGWSGTVWKGHVIETGKAVAVKVVDISRYKLKEQSVTVESYLLNKLDHPNIISAYETVVTDTHWIIIMEYATHGDLHEYIEEHRCTFDVIKQILRQLISALSYLHNQGYVHKDVKVENVLVNEVSDGVDIKLADFGFAASTGVLMRNTFKGTLGYCAPENFETSKVPKYLTHHVDLWSLGVILYALRAESVPFDQPNYRQKVLEGSFSFTSKFYTIGGSPELLQDERNYRDLIRRLLVVEPEKRIPLKDIVKHPFLN